MIGTPERSRSPNIKQSPTGEALRAELVGDFIYMLTPKEEDAIAKLLTNMTPMEYSSLMAKVNRVKWEGIPRSYTFDYVSSKHRAK